ncbi:MAG: MFS transporter [Clostridiaceae bacterium]|nr:MFS transporter [Clostridiaceae bacterium]
MNKAINTICYISLLFLGMYLAVYQVAINSISAELAVSSTVSGILISLLFVGIMIAPAIFGEISDRIGKKPVIIICFGIMIAGLLLVYFFNIVEFIAAGIFFIGCGFGAIEGLLSGLLADLNSKRTNKVINISQMYFSIGAVVGPVSAIWITGLLGNWKHNYVLLAVIFLLLLVIIAGQKHAEMNGKGPVTGDMSPGAPVPAPKGSISFFLLKEKRFILLYTAIFIYVGIEEATAFWANTYFIDSFGMEKLGAYALSGFWGSMIAGRYIGSRFEEKGNTLCFIGLLVSLISIILALMIKNPVFSMVCFVLLGLGFSVVWPVLMVTAARSCYNYTGSAMGLMMMSGAAGGIVVPLLMGAAKEFVDTGTAFLIVPFLACVILLLQRKIRKTMTYKYNI